MSAVSPFFTWRRAMTSSELPSTTKLVLFVIAEYANAMDDICWPSIGTIAEKASLSERSVSTHLEVAERHGWLARWRSRRPARRWAHAHYRLAIPKDVALRQRDAIDFDIIAGESERGSDVDETLGNLESASDTAEKCGTSERRSDDTAEVPERGSDTQRDDAFCAGEAESYLNDVPTNRPVNTNSKKNTLSQAASVNHRARDQNENRDDLSSSLARWMFERLRARDPGGDVPNWSKWIADVDAMLHVDGRDRTEIVRLYAWADRDKFWQRIVTSPARLRKNWDEVRRRRNASLEADRSSATPAAQAATDDRQCAHVENGCRCTRAASTIIGAGSSRRGYCGAHVGRYED